MHLPAAPWSHERRRPALSPSKSSSSRARPPAKSNVQPFPPTSRGSLLEKIRQTQSQFRSQYVFISPPSAIWSVPWVPSWSARHALAERSQRVFAAITSFSAFMTCVLFAVTTSCQPSLVSSPCPPNHRLVQIVVCCTAFSLDFWI